MDELIARKIRPIDLGEARNLIDEIEHTDPPEKTVIELNGQFYDVSLAEPEDVLWLMKNSKELML